MVFAECFLLELCRGRLAHHHFAGYITTHPGGLRQTIELASDKLEARVVEGRAAVVDDGNPAVEVGVLVVARNGKNVIGAP